MRIVFSSDSVTVGRTISDLLAVIGCEIAAAESHGIPALRCVDGRLELTSAQGDVQPLEQPVRLNQLAQHIRRLQSSARGAPLALAHGWRIEPLARMLHGPAAQHVPLTEKECLLLSALHRAYPGTAAREQLLKDVWAYDAAIETHTLETHIYRLRTKLTGLTPPPCDVITHDATYRLVLE